MNANPPQLAPPKSGASSSPWRWVRRLILTLAIALTLVVLFYAEENWRGSAAWARVQAELAAKGLPTSIPALAPAPVPEADNLAEAPLFSRALTFGRDPQTGAWIHFSQAAANRLKTVTLTSPQGRVKEPAPSYWWRGERLDLSGWQAYYRKLAATNALSQAAQTAAVQIDPTLAKRYGLKPSSSSNTILTTPPQSPTKPHEYEIPPDLAARYGLGTTHPSNEEFQRLFTFPVPATPGTPATDVLLALGKIAVELDALAVEAKQRTRSRFGITYEREPAAGIWLPHLALIKKLAVILRLRATARLHAGDSDGALQDVLLSTRIAEMPAEELFLISHLVRAADWLILLQPVWEGLQSHGWTDSHLATLIDRLESVDLLSGAPKFWLAESLSFGTPPLTTEARREILDLVQASSPEVNDPADWEWTRLLVLYAPRGWFLQNAARHFRRMQAEQSALQQWMNSPGMTNITLAPPAPPSIRLPPYEFILRANAATFYRRGVSKLIRAEAYRRLALVACALERHRIATKTYPETLAVLVPHQFRSLPVDPMSGEPLKYQRLNDGNFQLYSVGPDGRDDHGLGEAKPPTEDLIPVEYPEWGTPVDWIWPTASVEATRPGAGFQ